MQNQTSMKMYPRANIDRLGSFMDRERVLVLSMDGTGILADGVHSRVAYRLARMRHFGLV